MSYGNTPRDLSGIPVSSVYVPNTGFLALGGALPTTDGSGNSSATLSISQPVSSSATLTSVAGATGNTSILASNTSRKAAYVYNDSTAAMYLALGATATTTAFSFKVPANNLFELPTSPIWQGALSAVWDSATGSARVTEVV